MVTSLSYLKYLEKRSYVSVLYKRLFIWPFLKKHITGHYLDIGCGIGDFLIYHSGGIGADVNHYLVRKCISRGLIAVTIEAGILPYESERFDSILMDNVLEHICEPSILVSEIYRVLKPGGKLVIGLPGLKGFKADKDHKTYWTPDSVEGFMNSIGFDKELVKYIPFRSKFLCTVWRHYYHYSVFTR